MEVNDYDIFGYETTPEGCTIYLRLRRGRLNINVPTDGCIDSPKALASLESNISRINSDTEEEELWDYLQDVAEHFLTAFDLLVPPIQPYDRLTLADLQPSTYFECQLQFHDEVPRPGPILSAQPRRRSIPESEAKQDTQFQTPFPAFRLTDVEILYESADTVFKTPPEKVCVQGQILFWKPSWTSRESAEAVEKYAVLARSGIDLSTLLLSRLFGVVLDSRGELRGQLYHWIDIKSVLDWAVVEKAPDRMRQTWASQIQRTVTTLHSLNVVWGDVKAENVVIDQHDNAIVIDLEGGATRGWVDKEIMGTREGDLQGLERLLDYILDEDSMLRRREKDYQRSSDSDTDCSG